MYQRPRRNRKSNAVRKLVRETVVTSDDLVYPMFLTEGNKKKEHIDTLPGNYRWSLDLLQKEIEECMNLGLHSFMLFPKIDAKYKTKDGAFAYSADNHYLKAIRVLKRSFPEACFISDVALDPYNIDGHDGIVQNGEIVNDASVEQLVRMSLAQADAGFDILGPSDMMDGRVGAMRQALDEEGFSNTSIMSYTAKYASAFYGPFRDALDSAPVSDPTIPKDKKTYQMDPANSREALIEGELDTVEGADFLMVKPALHYMDIIQKMKEHFQLPIAAYHVSGECAMLLAAVEKGWLDYEKCMPEVLLSLKRAGTDVIISYFAKDFAKLSKTGSLK